MIDAGWLTIFEVLEATGIPYSSLMAMAESGELTTRASGTTLLYRADDVTRLAVRGITPAPGPA